MSARLFLAPEQFESGQAHLNAAQWHYLTRVLRLRPGAACIILDGCGKIWQAVLANEAVTLTAELLSPATEWPVQVRIACAVPKGERWEWLLQKATELGASEIIPLKTARSVVLPRTSKLERWQAIVREAAEQSERLVLPRVQPPLDFEAFLQQQSLGPGFICTARGERPSLWKCLAGIQHETVTLLSGPEGGFTPEEVYQAQRYSFQPVSVGTRILRAETAPLLALSWVGAWLEAAV